MTKHWVPQWISTRAPASGETPQIDDGWPRSPLADLPSGTAFGTLVHAVLENVDTESPDLPAELLLHCAEQLTRHPVDTTAGRLAEALLPVLHTQLGPLADGITLASLSPRDRLAELTFELPLMGGDRPNGTVTLGQVAALLRRHLPADDPLAGYPDHLAAPELADTPLRGYLTGSIDAVLRLSGPRYLVVDYKTNWLGEPAGPDLSAWHYRPSAMAAAMIGSHYPLQALLYSVALHRFLRWRQPGYDIERHVGGSPVPVRPGDVRGGHPGGGRDALRGVRVAPGRGADRRAVRAAGRGCSMTAAELVGSDVPDRNEVRSATGLLRDWNRAGVLEPADVHVATRLGVLGGEADQTVLLAAALVVRAARTGSTCVDLAEVTAGPDLELPVPPIEEWIAAVAGSPLTGEGLPLRWDADRLYLDRYWQEETQIGTDLLDRDRRPPPEVDVARMDAALQRLFEADADGQAAAARAAVLRWTTVLAGGPGTGKTTTVARVLAVLADQPGAPPRIALAAPTGKAAARLTEAVRAETADLAPADRARLGALTASTLHRLLGSLPRVRNRFRHNRDNRLPHDVVVVDEASMVSLTMMARLLEALRPDARLVLVGDPDQLASVEAGAVLADLVAGLTARPDPAAPAAGLAGPVAARRRPVGPGVAVRGSDR